MPPARKYLSESGTALNTLFEANLGAPQILKELLSELKHRTTPSAKSLRVKIENHLNGSNSSSQETPSPMPPLQPVTPPKSQTLDCRNCGTNMRIPVRLECAIYTCPKCKAEFETTFKNNVLNVVWTKMPDKEPRREEMTEEAAREILGVSSDADFVTIKTAWRKASQQYHPDKHQSLPARLRKAAEGEMKLINEAYRFLERTTASDF